MRIGKITLRLRTTITLMICTVLLMVLFVVYVLFGMKVTSMTEDALQNKALSIARTVSLTPIVIDGLEGEGDPEEVQRYAMEILNLTGVEFVVVMDMNGIRLSHPDPAMIGKHFIGGDEVAALHGSESVSTARGSLGDSVRAFSPIYGDDGTQVGAVAVGITLESVHTAVQQNRWIIYLGLLIGGLMGVAGAVFLAHKIKKMMFGMEPSVIAKLLEERSAMLQSAREGILAVDKNLKITLVNKEARRLMERIGVNEDTVNQLVGHIWPQLRMEKVLETGEPLQDIEVEQSGITLLVNVVPVRVGGQIEGVIASFRDKTEISVLMERLTGISVYADTLRAQTHEFMNKLHVITGLTHMQRYEQLEQYLAGILSHIHNETDAVIRLVKDPVMAGFLLGKQSRVREAGVKLELLEEGMLPEATDPDLSRELVTIVGNLLENALEACQGSEDKVIRIGFRYEDDTLYIRVVDNGMGIPGDKAEQLYEQGYSTKGKDRGIGLYLVKKSLDKLGGSISWESRPEQGTEFTVQLPYEVNSEE
ncbi:DcuS/MalK family sensor histidine kinase [Paenibacillus marinisediminis]